MAVARPTPPISSAPGGCCWQLPWLAPGWSPCSWQTAHGPGFNGNTGNAMLPPARRDLQDLPDVPHGALDFSELELHGLHPGQVIDFSTNTNAFGPPPEVRAAVAAAVAGTTLEQYPDRQALELRRSLAAHLRISSENILVGNGTAELIQLAALAYLE